MRVLMVIAPTFGTEQPAVWARRQIESLKTFGVTVETYVFRNRRSVLGLWKGGLALRRKARECGADLVHVHYSAAQGFIAAWLANKPVVISFCGSDLLGNYDTRGRKTWSGRLSGLLSQLGAIRCRRAIAKSEELRQALWLRPMRNKCDVIPNGVDLKQFYPMPKATARTALGWNHDDPVVLFMDRKGAWVKDPALAHAAYREARKQVGDLRLHVVEHECPDKMPLFYNAADVLLLTSRHEGSNNTVKEALACNLPVVATRCGDVQERLRGVHTCYVCARDPQELGSRIGEIVARRERSNGREHLPGLTLERVARAIVRCYEQALGGQYKEVSHSDGWQQAPIRSHEERKR